MLAQEGRILVLVHLKFEPMCLFAGAQPDTVRQRTIALYPLDMER
jgi:hypothetical protein